MTPTTIGENEVRDERLGEMLAEANALDPSHRSVTMNAADVIDLRTALRELIARRSDGLGTVSVKPWSAEQAEAAARALYEADDVWSAALPWPSLTEGEAGADGYRRLALAALNAAASIPASRRAETGPDEMLVAALRGLVLLKDLFDVSDRNQADAYYILAKQDGAWGAARSALAALPAPQPVQEQIEPVQKTHELVEQAFRDGIAYASLCEVTDVDLAWSQSRARAALVKP